MPKFIGIAVETPEDYLRKIPLRALAIDADGGVWRGEASTPPLGPTVFTWQPVTCAFVASGPPAKPWGGPSQQDAEEDELEP
jgi:hypothetical protein